ncbi:type I DNA topoisomerase [Rhabdothermincola salaria]|uniref:type I DNA topoisomerase n=1 Tax=Rhabdothermincola salaria TaxID=2903142 RepID=UPI001E5D1E18|nr:type I DNA topoisomerase [Rhabdothermincola salaria]MCD9624642.1 type I DNA topoisomerase [Rhabdothermincola salaria]
MAGPLVIVESPAKAKKIQAFLGQDAQVAAAPTVLASIGHVRDLARRAKELPAAVQKEKWARLAIDTDNGFKAYYVVPENKKSVITELKRAMKDADALYLATDEDREGEAIAWHLLEVLKPPSTMPVHRMVFHEITAPAIREAFANPRELNNRLVDAQETRRLLDRLYGYDVSEVAWKKVNPGLSAGRVQSVATRLVVEREREIMAFVPAGYWDLEGVFAAAAAAGDTEEAPAFGAKLVALDGTRLASGGDFSQQGELTRDDRLVLDETGARTLATELEDAPFSVRSVESKPYRKRPFAPFITSTLQQVAGRALKISAKQVMSMAQRLYQDGYITYMRTDSTALSSGAVEAARAEATERFGAASVPSAPRSYAKKVANAQEAHEAIRPSGDRFRSPEEVAREVQPGDARLYELIWRRTVASQMNDAIGETVTVRLGALTGSGRDAEFSAAGTVITDRGWMQVEPWRSDDDEERRLPALTAGDALDASDLSAEGHTTKAPARFTEASLVAKLEEIGVGRPSTYASIMETIQNRGYVWKKGSALVPSWTAFAVTTMLERHFAELVDYGFTRELEEVLDAISVGDAEMVPTLEDFYFGPRETSGERHGGLRDLVTDRLPEIDAAAINTFPIGEDPAGVPVVAKPGRYGPYVQRGTDTASIPDDLPPADLDVEHALELLAMPKGGKPLGEDPDTGLTVLVMNGRFGPYVQLGEVDDDPDGKPKRASLFAGMDPQTIELDEALRLLSLPRVVGTAPDGDVITAQNGKFGPYLTKGADGKDSRSLGAEEELFTVTLDEALKLFAEPKRRGRAAPKPPLAELGPDPVTGKPMVVKDGRFGPYVTDGETNASLRVGDEPSSLSPERGAELLQTRRDAVANGEVGLKKKPAKKRATKAGAKKKATKKKATKKKAAGDGVSSTVSRTVGARARPAKKAPPER